jgi:lipopolysaccharide transport system permease protein
MLGVYYFVFGIILEARFTDVERSAEGPGFALTLFCGIVVYNMFSSSVSKAPLLILERKSYVKKVVFPSEILAVALLLAGMFQGMISFIILLAALIISSVTIPWTIALFPIVLLPLMALTLGAIWYLAFAGVFFRDISHMVMALLQLLFFASPVIYTLAQVPEGYQSMLRLNPLTTILEDARRTLLWGNTPDWFWWFIVMIVSLIVMHSGYMWFMKLKRDFADTI